MTAARFALDASAWIGTYPFRHMPHPDPDALLRVMDRESIARAWVGSLAAVFHRDPTDANAELYRTLAPLAERLRPAPIIRPDFPGMSRALDMACDVGAESVRACPEQWGLGSAHPAMTALALACAERGLALHLTVRYEDLRQRHRMDTAADLPAATVRALARAGGDALRLVISAAGRELIEETHWGLTPAEQRRVSWDFSWVWGPPEDHLAHLFRSIGSQRFVFGSQWPLRLVQAPIANLDLLPDSVREPSGAIRLGNPSAR